MSKNKKKKKQGQKTKKNTQNQGKKLDQKIQQTNQVKKTTNNKKKKNYNKKKNNNKVKQNIQKVTEPVTEALTEVQTEIATELVTEPITEAITEVITEPATETKKEKITEVSTEVITEAVTEPLTEVIESSKKVKKKKGTKKVFRIILCILTSLLLLGGSLLDAYSIILYDGAETLLRILAISITVYFFLFLTYLLFRSIKRKAIAFVIPFLISIIVILTEATLFYYLNKIYTSIDDLSDNKYMKYTSLVTYDLSLSSKEDLIDKKIGITNDKDDYEGNILPKEVIEKLKLDENNTIVVYDSTLEELYALKNNEIDAGFFSRNYVDMFYSLEDFEDIEEETKVIYEERKEYQDIEEDIKSEGASLNKPFSMLLIGVDSSKNGVTSGYNADVLLLVTFNPKTLRATLTSIPRDMYLKTACSNGKYRRINTTTWGSSSSCAVKTVENMFGVNIDYYAKVNFKGVVQLVDAVGGIDVDVDYSICEQNSSRKWGDNTQYIEAGHQHLNGEQALAFARNRHKPNDGSKIGKTMGKYCPKWNKGTRNDYTRGKNQMKVIVGIIKSATKMDNPNDVVGVLDKIKSNFQTNVKSKDLLQLYNLAKSIMVSDNTNIVNIQRMQLSGFGKKIYEPQSKSYPSVTFPYQGSINDIKKEIKANLKNSSISGSKKISFDLNKPYKDKIIGQGSYSAHSIPTLKNLSGSSVSSIKSYASSNGLKLQFIDKSNGQVVDINDFSEYTFQSQKEHKDTILNQISSLTIYVKKKVVNNEIKEENTQ